MDRTGERVDGRYDLLRELGRGGVCTVYEAEHVYTRRRVAVKLLNADLADHPEARTRLLREARALGALRHPNVLDVLDAGMWDDTPYVVTEMLEGRTLEGLLTARQRLSVGDAVALAIQLARGLEAAHTCGVVHRDVKPSNVMLVRGPNGTDVARLVDFGIARIPAEPTDSKLTGIDTIVGTPEFMAPEQLLAKPGIDARADIYSLGVTLFESITGVVPRAGTYQEVLMSLATSPEPASARALCPEVSLALDAVITRCLAREVDHRYARGAELATALTSTGVASRAIRLLDHVAPTTREAASRVSLRVCLRAPYVTLVRLTHGESTVDGRTEDISEGGLLVITTGKIAQGTQVQVRFALPTMGAMVTCSAEVRWIRQRADRGGPFALGVEFVNLRQDVRAQIAEYVGLMAAP